MGVVSVKIWKVHTHGECSRVCGKVDCPVKILSIKRSHHLCGLRQSGFEPSPAHPLGAHDLATGFGEGWKINLTCAILLRCPVDSLLTTFCLCLPSAFLGLVPLPYPSSCLSPLDVYWSFNSGRHWSVCWECSCDKADEDPGTSVLRRGSSCNQGKRNCPQDTKFCEVKKLRQWGWVTWVWKEKESQKVPPTTEPLSWDPKGRKKPAVGHLSFVGKRRRDERADLQHGLKKSSGCFCSGNIKMFQDFPGGLVAKNLPASTGDTGSISGPGRYHMPQSTWTREPQLLKPTILEPRLCNKRSHQNEKPTHHN